MRETRRERIRDGERELVMGEDGEMIRERERERVSWCFKPSQPHRIISGLKETFIRDT